MADGSRHPCGFWPEELAVPHDTFREAGFDITIATPGAAVPIADEAGFTAAMNVGSEEPGKRFHAYLHSIAEELRTPVDLNRAEAADFDLVFVPGGHGPMEDLAVSPAFGELMVEFTKAGKAVAAVCHGPAALLPALDTGNWLFAGRRVTGFSNAEEAQVGFADKAAWCLEDRLVSAGGKFEQSGSPWQPHAVVDGNLYTGQNSAASAPLADRLVAEYVVLGSAR